MTNIKIHDSWKNELVTEFNSQYMSELRTFLKEQIWFNKLSSVVDGCWW